MILMRSAAVATDRLEYRRHRSGQLSRGNQEKRAWVVGIQRPVDAIARVQSHLAQEISRHRDRPGLLYRVRAVQHIDGKIHSNTLEAARIGKVASELVLRG